MSKKINLLNFNKVKFTKLNDQFLLAKCYVLALGKNQNKTHFAKENVEKAYETLNYIPVIGHIMTDDNGNYYLGGHDVKLDLSDGFKLKNLCLPYGVAIPSPTPTYEEVTEEDGTQATYLVSNVILWTGRYPELEKSFYNEDILCGQSMEILYENAKPLEEDNDYLDIIDFSFDALCMLGKSDDKKFNVDPCFPNAKIESLTYSLDENIFSKFKDDLIKELGSLKILDFCKEGGFVEMDEKLELLKKYSLKSEDLDFQIDDLSLDELEDKLKTFKAKQKEPKYVSKFATYKEKSKALGNLFSDKIEKDENDEIVKETYFWVMDFDENYAYVEESVWEKDKSYTNNYFRFSYTYDEETSTATLTGEKEKLFKMWLTQEEKNKLNESKQEFEAYKETHSFTNEEYQKLETYKKDKEKQEFDSFVNKMSDDFSDIVDKKEFEKLYEDRNKYTKDEYEKECIYIRGLYSKPVNKSTKKDKGLLTFGVVDEHSTNNEDPRAYLFEKYLNK